MEEILWSAHSASHPTSCLTGHSPRFAPFALCCHTFSPRASRSRSLKVVGVVLVVLVVLLLLVVVVTFCKNL